MGLLGILILIALPGGGPSGAAAAVAQQAAAYTPKQGTPERKAILDAVRRELRIKSQFQVHHLKVNQGWAYFRGGEVVPLEGGELQETDLGVAVLLKRAAGAGGAWAVVEIWTLPTEDEKPFAKFAERVRRRQKSGRIPGDIFPDEL